MGSFTYNEHSFLMNGAEYTVISGAMHYFRIPREYWRDRLLKLKECGFNTVETYTAWNLHERREGEFDFSGMLDIGEYISLAEEVGLNVILRPGPYICSEWEFGGLPSWLLTYRGMSLRSNDGAFLAAVRRYYTRLFDELRGHFISSGGGIIMVQIENEYGSYGDDKDYLRAIAEIYRECGVDCLLFTSDGTSSWMLGGGTLPEYLCVANFGSNPEGNFNRLRKFRGDQPLMCGEYWCGWFDHWYEGHHTREPGELAGLFRDMVDSGASLNFYMFHGGTNFGFTNGANCGERYEPTVTSYDYCALLSEAGDLTPAYHAVRAIIEEKYGALPPLTVGNTPKAAYGRVTLDKAVNIFDAAGVIGRKEFSPSPKTMEDMGQDFGFVLYSTVVKGPREPSRMILEDLHDRANIFVNGGFAGIYERDRRADEVTIAQETGEDTRIDILVENMGRINYGPHMGFSDRKGMTGMRLGQLRHFGWETVSLGMENLGLLDFGGAEDAKKVSCPAFFEGEFEIDGKVCDTFIEPSGFTHGFITVNGFNLGRYYNPAGPQKTLYCPAGVLRRGRNKIIIFETDAVGDRSVEFRDTPKLG